MEAAAVRSGGFGGEVEWVDGFDEWVRQNGLKEWVFWVLGMGVVGCNQVGLSLNKKKWRGQRSWRGLQIRGEQSDTGVDPTDRCRPSRTASVTDRLS